MSSRLSLAVASLVASALVAACSARDSITAPTSTLSATPDGASIAASLRLRCELRVGKSSRISVDGNNLVPLNGTFRAGVRSGGVTVAHPALQAIGDEVEFDFSSDPNDIAAGAQPIASDYIKVNAAGPDVEARIVDATGATVAQGGADCRVR